MTSRYYSKKIALVILQVLFLFSFSLSQQKSSRIVTGIIKGSLIDSLKQLALGYATITVHEKGNADAIKSIFTNENGSFEISGVPYKQLQLTISSVGYKEKTMQLPTFTSSIIFVGKISLAAEANQLREVKVVADKILVRQDIDKLTYNVSADPESRTLSTLDMLRKVPLVSVDADDNIQLSGSGSYKVLINGRSSSLFANKVSDVFRAMPASSIKSIEIITNPSAKYEAEGIGGIINIIIYKKNIDGYNGSVNIGASTPTRINSGGYLTAKTGKIGLSNSFGYNLSLNPIATSTFIREDKLYRNNLSQTGESSNKSSFVYVATDVSYELDSTNLLTGSVNINNNIGNSDFNRSVQLFNAANTVIKEYNNSNRSDNTWMSYDLGLDFQHSFKKNKDRMLTLSYVVSNNKNESNTKYSTQPITNYKGEENLSENAAVFKESTLQADYVHPINDQTLEIGIKSITRFNNSNYWYKNQVGGTGLFILDSTLTNNFDYTQTISAAYTSLTLKKDNWGFKAGARLEETITNANFKSSQTSASQNYFNVIPNLTVTRKLKRTTTLKLSYTQRIERPSLYYLDPFIDISDPKNIYFGNPKLRPATANVFNVSFRTFMKGSSINANVFHHFTNNSILRYTTLRQDTVAQTTFGNIGRDQAYGLSFNSSINLYKNLSISLNNTNSYLKFTSTINNKPQTSEGFMFNVFAYTSYRLPKGWRTSGSINYSSASVLIQGKQAGFFSNTLAINKEFLKNKKASISLTASNPFQKNRRVYTETNDPTFYQLQTSYVITRRFNVAFNYRFGKLQEDIARKKRGIKNDDLKTTDQTDISN